MSNQRYRPALTTFLSTGLDLSAASLYFAAFFTPVGVTFNQDDVVLGDLSSSPDTYSDNQLTPTIVNGQVRQTDPVTMDLTSYPGVSVGLLILYDNNTGDLLGWIDQDSNGAALDIQGGAPVSLFWAGPIYSLSGGG